jgi:uncharacterized membrane protein
MAVTGQHQPPMDPRTYRVERIISAVLRGGVAMSLVLVVGGTVLSFVHHPVYVRSASELARLTRPGAAFPHTIHDVLVGLREWRGQAVVVVGLLVLVATPVARVAISIVLFLATRDRVFVIITTLVLALLLLSFFLGTVGG